MKFFIKKAYFDISFNYYLNICRVHHHIHLDHYLYHQIQYYHLIQNPYNRNHRIHLGNWLNPNRIEIKLSKAVFIIDMILIFKNNQIKLINTNNVPKENYL